MTASDPELQNLHNNLSKEALSGLPVFPLIHIIRKDVEVNIGVSFNPSWVVRMNNLGKISKIPLSAGRKYYLTSYSDSLPYIIL